MDTPETPDDMERELRESMAAQGGPIIGRQRAALGADRFARFLRGHAELQAMILCLVMSVNTTPGARYSDDALDALIHDANDVKKYAAIWADECAALASMWRAQRQEREK